MEKFKNTRMRCIHCGHGTRQEEETRRLEELNENLFSSLTGFLFSDEGSPERSFQKLQQVDFLQDRCHCLQYKLN